jgi:membrane protein DedA with SNARE-associated domain
MILEYRGREKKWNFGILFLASLGICILGYFFYTVDFTQKSQDKNFLLRLVEMVWVEITNQTNFGFFMTSLLGGLFFLVFPLEYYFFSSLGDITGSIWIKTGVYYLGLMIAQSLNYWLGLRANRFCKLLIPAKNFYRWKGSLNRWGFWVILLMNSLPLPSPVFSAVLGAFKYNYKKFIITVSLGAAILYSTITLIFVLINSQEFEELSWLGF